MTYGKHPYWETARERDHEAWLEELRTIARDTARPIRGRVLPTIDLDASQTDDASAIV